MCNLLLLVLLQKYKINKVRKGINRYTKNYVPILTNTQILNILYFGMPQDDVYLSLYTLLRVYASQVPSLVNFL